MGKYIIELKRGETAYKTTDSNGTPLIQLLALTPYTEPDLEVIKKEAYDKGFEDGKELCPVPEVCHENAYQRGLNDAWDVAKKISIMDSPTRDEIFGLVVMSNIIDENSAPEAIEKIRKYEQEQDEIKVGNEVNGKGGRGIITKISNDGDHFNVMWENGSTGYYMREDFKKTGRHFPEIAEVFKKMQEVRE